jgi:hypothetical protein
MRDVAQESYDNCKIGAIGWIRPDLARGETLEVFQSVLLAAKALQESGKILIQEMHRESYTGHRLVDAIKFMRVR